MLRHGATEILHPRGGGQDQMRVDRSAHIFQSTEIHELRRFTRTNPGRVDQDQAGLTMTAYAIDHISRGLSRFQRDSQDIRIHAELFDRSRPAGIECDQGNRSVFLKPVVGRKLHDRRSLAHPARPDKHGNLAIVLRIQQGSTDPDLLHAKTVQAILNFAIRLERLLGEMSAKQETETFGR